MSRYTTQVSSDETTAADSAPSFASASSAPEKARSAISSATVKPMPAMVPLPSTAAQPTGGRIRPWLSRVTTEDVDHQRDRFADDVADQHAERDRRSCTPYRRKSGLSSMPALASANSGTIR